jgi:ECF transporter S component (folate family)
MYVARNHIGGSTMIHFVALFTKSWKELKKIRTITAVAMFMAVAVVLGSFAIIIGDYIKISFAFIANELTSMLFGPVVGGIMGGLTDVLKYIVKPTGPFFFGFTFNAILGGIIYGSILYKRPVSFIRILIAKVIVMVIINLCLTTLWLSILYGQAFMALLSIRVIKEAIMLPIETSMLFITAKALEKTPLIKEVLVTE